VINAALSHIGGRGMGVAELVAAFKFILDSLTEGGKVRAENRHANAEILRAAAKEIRVLVTESTKLIDGVDDERSIDTFDTGNISHACAFIILLAENIKPGLFVGLLLELNTMYIGRLPYNISAA
jgi:hypothetical protein